MKEKDILKTKELIAQANKILILGHKGPDGDSMGSCLALQKILSKQGKTAQVLMPDAHPNFLNWMPGAKEVINFVQNTDLAIQSIKETDLIFTLDFNDLSRVGNVQPYLEEAHANSKPFIMIDHHKHPADYAEVTYSDTEICSTSQMMYQYLEYLNQLDLLDKDIATCLYTGIMTDTGSFKFPRTTPTTHRVVANLIEAGADNVNIHREVFDTNSENRLRILSKALNNLVVLREYKTAYIHLSHEELEALGYQKGDVEGVVNYALSIDGIVFAGLFRESKEDNAIRISLRSKGDFKVNDFSNQHFNGGGHNNAAGGRSEKSLSETLTYFEETLKDYKEELENA